MYKADYTGMQGVSFLCYKFFDVLNVSIFWKAFGKKTIGNPYNGLYAFTHILLKVPILSKKYRIRELTHHIFRVYIK